VAQIPAARDTLPVVTWRHVFFIKVSDIIEFVATRLRGLLGQEFVCCNVISVFFTQNPSIVGTIIGGKRLIFKLTRIL
jgi:hypothetical protein